MGGVLVSIAPPTSCFSNFAAQLSGVHESATWRLRLSLCLMEVDANDMMRQLSQHQDNPDAFCRALTVITDGVVEYFESIKTTEV